MNECALWAWHVCSCDRECPEDTPPPESDTRMNAADSAAHYARGSLAEGRETP